eukprot:scaffold2882_cov434-Prasinococcus_capsulatus_cf.AAC.15
MRVPVSCGNPSSYWAPQAKAGQWPGGIVPQPGHPRAPPPVPSPSPPRPHTDRAPFARRRPRLEFSDFQGAWCVALTLPDGPWLARVDWRGPCRPERALWA